MVGLRGLRIWFMLPLPHFLTLEGIELSLYRLFTILVENDLKG